MLILRTQLSQVEVFVDWTDFVSIHVVFNFARSKKRMLAAACLYDMASTSVPSRLRSWHGVWNPFDQADVILFNAVGYASKWTVAFFCRGEHELFYHLGNHCLHRSNRDVDGVCQYTWHCWKLCREHRIPIGLVMQSHDDGVQSTG